MFVPSGEFSWSLTESGSSASSSSFYLSFSVSLRETVIYCSLGVLLYGGAFLCSFFGMREVFGLDVCHFCHLFPQHVLAIIPLREGMQVCYQCMLPGRHGQWLAPSCGMLRSSGLCLPLESEVNHAYLQSSHRPPESLSSELNSPIPVHFSSLIPRMSTFTLAISCLTTSNLP